jgi:hypothetical protein
MLAAVLACGDGAVVSHGSAAELLGLWDKRTALIDISGGAQAGRKVKGLRCHRTFPLEPDEVTVHAGVPSTTVARTLVDMAGQVEEKSLRRLVEQAAVLRLLDVQAVDSTLARGRRRGAPMMRRVVAPWRGAGKSPRIRSRLEARVYAAAVEAGLPRPRCNVLLEIDEEPLEVDLLWHAQRLVIETDGEETHGTRAAFQQDRRRDQVLTAAGYRTSRVTWRQMEDEPEATLERIGRMLARG